MLDTKGLMHRTIDRRSLLQKGALVAGAVAIGAGLFGAEKAASGQDRDDRLIFRRSPTWRRFTSDTSNRVARAFMRSLARRSAIGKY